MQTILWWMMYDNTVMCVLSSFQLPSCTLYKSSTGILLFRRWQNLLTSTEYDSIETYCVSFFTLTFYVISRYEQAIIFINIWWPNMDYWKNSDLVVNFLDKFSNWVGEPICCCAVVEVLKCPRNVVLTEYDSMSNSTYM